MTQNNQHISIETLKSIFTDIEDKNNNGILDEGDVVHGFQTYVHAIKVG